MASGMAYTNTIGTLFHTLCGIQYIQSTTAAAAAATTTRVIANNSNYSTNITKYNNRQCTNHGIHGSLWCLHFIFNTTGTHGMAKSIWGGISSIDRQAYVPLGQDIVGQFVQGRGYVDCRAGIGKVGCV